MFFVLGVAHGDPIIVEVQPKNGNFQMLQHIFFRTTESQLQLLTLIESSNIFHWKRAKRPKVGVVLRQNLGQIRSIVVKKVKKNRHYQQLLFSCFTQGIPFKAKRSGCTSTEWKFQANIAINTASERRQGHIFSQFWSKMAKN